MIYKQVSKVEAGPMTFGEAKELGIVLPEQEGDDIAPDI